MPGVILGVEIVDDSLIKSLRGMLPAIKKAALRETAEHFHREFVPRRFKSGNDRYRHEQRNQVYKDRIKKRFGIGDDKNLSNKLSGKTQRRAALETITATQYVAVLRVDTPTYVRRPFVGVFRDQKTGKSKRVTRQPDQVSELSQIPDSEKRELRDYYAERLGYHIQNPPERKTRRQTVRP